MKRWGTAALSLLVAGGIFILQMRRGLGPNAEPLVVAFAALLLALAALRGVLALWRRLRG